jgi:aldehyde dehydrogenase (NAD+)/betaine-aldehyde dehydrogenase
MDKSTEMGPLTSQRQQQSVLTYCDVARQQGAQFLLGGSKPTEPELSKGFFVRPTVVRASPADRVNQEEVFGPFLSVTTFRDEADAIRIANSTQYGLGAGLWTADLTCAHRVAGAIRAGMVWINCYKRVNPGSPFGGIGSSGYGREMGFEAMHDYTEAKSIWVNVDARMPAHYARP